MRQRGWSSLMPSNSFMCSIRAKLGCGFATRLRVMLRCYLPNSSHVSRMKRTVRCCETASSRQARSRKADFDLEKIIERVLNSITTLDTGQGGALQAELERAMTSRRSETILLIGNKGAGKSTFIDRFFEQVLPRRLRDKCVVVRVDLEKYHGDPSAIVSWAILQLRSHLEAADCSSNPPSYDELMGIFFSEYQRWSVGSRKHLYEFQ